MLITIISLLVLGTVFYLTYRYIADDIDRYMTGTFDELRGVFGRYTVFGLM